MKPARIFWGSLAVFSMMLATGPAAFAQQGERNQGDQPAASQAQEQRDQGQQDADRQRRRGNQRNQRSADQQSRAGQQGDAALEHFLAGYYAGYTDGWSDGAHDLVITVMDEQRQRARQQVAAGRDPARMQSGRAAAREQMRNRMRGMSGRQGADSEHKHMSSRRSAVSVEGEVIALKTVALQGTDVEHRVARIRTSQGHTRVVELGPKKQTEQLNLQQGDTIQVSGAPATAGDMRILVAQHVTADDQKVNIKYKRLNPQHAGEKAGSKSRRQRNQSGRQDDQSDRQRNQQEQRQN